MKKFVTFIVAVLFLSTSSGASIRMHYCMGKLADWGFMYRDSKTCENCGMEESDTKDNGCCKDENKFVKNISEQKITESVSINFTLTILDLPLSLFSLSDIFYISSSEEYPISHAPPRNCKTPVYLLNRTILI
ncbi:MAG: hypothetical protein RLZZ429_934 [Bacteroidota bacterium]|jgi:hypothetical protein|nr:hypothetical protein TEGAF0_08550 [Sediminibacterium sp. TEGAF015]